ncbi:MAG: hypothetical protein RDV41_02760 [Planctomycetota bacterium]|nr:hypothetical protein [Planctomycetota bacterium]
MTPQLMQLAISATVLVVVQLAVLGAFVYGVIFLHNRNGIDTAVVAMSVMGCYVVYRTWCAGRNLWKILTYKDTPPGNVSVQEAPAAPGNDAATEKKDE